MASSPQEQGEGVSDLMDKIVTCNSCGYSAELKTYVPALSMNNDCRCPKCYSTDNKHNEEYADVLWESMRKLKEKDESKEAKHE